VVVNPYVSQLASQHGECYFSLVSSMLYMAPIATESKSMSPSKRFLLLACLLPVLALLVVDLTGCTSVARGLGKVTANKYAEPRSGTVWVVPPPQLEPPRAEDKEVYISFRNISDADIDLTDELRAAAKEQGWTIANDPQDANFRLRASLRFFGEVEPESGGGKVAGQMGAISGAAVGIGTGVAVGRGTGSTAAGIATGVGAGGLAAVGISNASRPREWALIMDFVLEEHHQEPIEFTMATGSSSGRGDAAGVGNARMASGGGTQSGNVQRATATKTSHYYPHGLRLSAWANQMNMTEEEAMPHIRQRTRKVVAQMLPQ